ncbi:uncharacterized protein LOC101850152 [Aplysia californica]|uniref:Uncharacterized protein LOC101850152 n=1 Tax=Aplysia californica TaxID=6500 RepID=A0ABM0ZVX0_APLCA|nr:uncharacterized protein LOC101850152 [Aplysia californica]
MNTFGLHRSVLFAFILMTACAHFCESAAFLNTGECPDNHKPGDQWFKPGCQRCNCMEGMWSCVSCGVYSFDNIDLTKCYIQHKTELDYPDCCTPHITCKGDEGFDDTLLTLG